MATDIKLGVLGLGRMGFLHCEYISATPGLTLAAASSRSRLLRNSAENKFSIRVYSSHDQLLQDSDLQWIVISTYSDQHKLWALKALSCGKSLIIEKPAALNGKEAEGIFSEAAKRGLKVTVHQNRRWDQDFLLVSRVLEENLLGEVYRIESRYTDFSTDWPGWKHPIISGLRCPGGVLWEQREQCRLREGIQKAGIRQK
ncbi:Inositol 2-dehydrogenase/D-chiro-inositol 3-dehydrogenase [subsurface metagenome]